MGKEEEEWAEELEGEDEEDVEEWPEEEEEDEEETLLAQNMYLPHQCLL